jgi:pectin methylesterase-like acyl-CoA thioesterase
MFPSYVFFFLAFLALLIFLYGVLRIMTDPDRVLSGSDSYGSRTMLVDGLGNGDYTTIQAAIDAAYSQTPTATSRWLVRVAPGEYTESLTLYDYVDIAGVGPGSSVYLITPPAQPAINGGAKCTISNIRIRGDNDPVIKSGTFSGTLVLYNVVAAETDASITFIQATSGVVDIRYSYIDVGGRLLYVTAGTVYAYGSTLREYNTDSGGDTYAVLEIDGAATIEM